MKQFISLIAAAILGGVVVLGGAHYFSPLKEQNNDRPFVRYTYDDSGTEAITKPTAPMDFTKAAEKAMVAVVHIRAKESQQMAQQRRQQQQRRSPFSFFFDDDFFFGNPFDRRQREGSGSGVIISQDGYIITNNHVIEFADQVEVTLHDNRKFNAEILGRDPQTDVAVLKIESSGLKYIEQGNSDNLKVGEWVLAVGNPFNLTSTVTAGIVSAKGRRLDIRRDASTIESFIQTDAAVNPGNSGGALVDTEGRLVGINTAIASPTGNFAGYSFAIPVSIAMKIVEDIIEFGEYRRAYLGVGITDNDSELARELGISETTGVVIMDVYDGGSAQYAGLLPNDVVLKVNNVSVRNVPELQEQVGRAKVGETLTLTINRKGKVRDMKVTLRSAS